MGVRVKQSDKKTVDSDFALNPIVTEKVKKAIDNLLNPVVLKSLWKTRKHTQTFKAGALLRHLVHTVSNIFLAFRNKCK